MMVDMIVRMVKMIRNMRELYFYVKKERIQRRAFGNTAVIIGHYYKEKGRRGVKKKRNAPKERSVEISFAYSNVAPSFMVRLFAVMRYFQPF